MSETTFLLSKEEFKAVFKFEHVNKEYYNELLDAIKREINDSNTVSSNYLKEKIDSFLRLFDIVENFQQRVMEPELLKEYKSIVELEIKKKFEAIKHEVE